MTSYAVVVPTLVRDTLADCLASLAAARGPRPDEIVLVDDRPDPGPPPEALDHALRVLDAGWRIRRGRRRTLHPVRDASRWASLRQQRGNADDALMRRLHGPDWWDKAVAPRGRIRRHAAITAAGAAACALAAAGRRRAATACALGWAAGTAEFARARIAPGPRTRDEVTTMLATSVAIPPAATWHRLAGAWRHRNASAWQEAAR